MKQVIGFLIALFSFSAWAEKMELDVSKSEIKWKGKKVVGEHHGTVKLKQGFVELDKGAPKSGEFEIDFTTITDLDLTNMEYKNKLETHLKSEDFFNAGKFPIGKFVLKSASAVKNEKNKFEIMGDLTIKNITKPVKFMGDVVVDGKKASAKAAFKINRLDWDIKYNSGKFFDIKKLGDKMILDDLEIELDLATK